MSSRVERSGLGSWLILAAPVGGAIAIAVVLLTLFPGDPSGEVTHTAPPTEEAVATAEVRGVDPGAPAPTPGATPHPATRRGTAWSVLDGRLYLVGGTSASRLTTSTVMFDGRLWHELPSIPTPRAGAALGALSDGTLVLAGGQADGVPLNETLVLQPGAGEWMAGPPMPHPQAFPAYAMLDDRLYLFGGTQPGRESAAIAFDAAAGAWVELTPLPTPLSRGAAAAYGDALYVSGGVGQDGTPRTDALRYDPITATWIQLAALPVGASSHASVVIGDRMWLIGTGSFTSQGFGPIPVYDFASDTWELVPDPNGQAAGDGVAAMVQSSGDIFVVGALGGTSTVRTAP